MVVDNIKLYEAWAEEYPYPTFGSINIIGAKFTDMCHDGIISKVILLIWEIYCLAMHQEETVMIR